MVTKAARVSARFSKSLTRRRLRPNQEKVRSTRHFVPSSASHVHRSPYNALMIAEVLKGMPHSTRAADIRKALQRDRGVSISFPSIRQALDQLVQRGQVEPTADRKTWRYVA
jgi:hypothetical protein